MENIEVIIRKQLKILSEEYGLDIIIQDKYNLLENDKKFENIIELNKWHCNPYCLKIKSQPKLHSKCVYFKKNYDEILYNANSGCLLNLYCGVAEYAVPIIIEGAHLCTVAVTGIKGRIKDNTLRILANRIGCSVDELEVIRNENLLSTDDIELIKNNVDVLAFLLYEHYNTIPNISAYIGAKNEEDFQNYITAAIDYIHHNFQKKLTIDEIASHCCISTSYLKHQFKKIRGITISEQIREERMEKSCELLCTTKHSIKFIAYSVGFDNSDYFSAVFTNYYKIPPLKYRKKYSILK